MLWKKENSEEDRQRQEKIRNLGKFPNHLAVIMDGNGRWALERGLGRINGHQEGINSVRDIVKASSQLGIKYLTLYAFSNENWNRPADEVGGLMKILEFYLRKEFEELHKNQVRINAIGKLSSLPKVVQKLLHDAMEKTKDNQGLTLTLALSYSGRWDIVRAVQMISLDVRRGKVSPEDINEELFSSYLQTEDIPDPDFLIRTSGEMRLSNFLLWEMAYGEMYITRKFWPEFRRDDLYEALESFMSRERRYGRTTAQLKNSEEGSQNESYFKRVVKAIKSTKK